MLPSLSYLRLSSCGLTGKDLFGGYVNSTLLEHFDVSVNRIGGEIPVVIQKMKAIKVIDLSANLLNSSIPSWLGNLRNLVQVNLGFNYLTGGVPKEPSGGVCIGNGLEKLRLRWNNLSRPLHDWLDLTNNLISGPLPQYIGNMTPRLDNLLWLSGDIPNCWSDFKILAVPDLSKNNLSGVIPSSFGNATSLASLHLSNNKLHGAIPSSLRQCKNLVILDLGENALLSGYLPKWIGKSLLNLEILRLRSNKLTGNIPSEICQLSQLQILDLAQNNISGSIPPCFGNFSGMISLNRTTSEIGIYKRSTTYGENMFQCMKNLEYTKTLRLLINMDISSNQIIGTIPEELTNLIALHGLNLSNNHLQGHIPNTTGALNSLESLDFSRNQLSGSIPGSIAFLTSLSHLNLSYNMLSGKIPTGNRLQTLVDPSIYAGNSGLCGAPLPECAASDEPPQAEDEGKKKGNISDFEWFCIPISAGTLQAYWEFYVL
ncbi:hypothetical protein FEM48_Zijuj08G0197400 [Ziziphus jujuba var. spinosa]|uniref:Uncharacterized protein n=1 Tax=Ziziphus jujuba var. spinosa TaxID=714518 RepID=A0A978V109_ZIZJJ|nr:hypothetical protein FEM48_Zijuj08G0197400 [Ziziphus jujuba var. spinosa]